MGAEGEGGEKASQAACATPECPLCRPVVARFLVPALALALLDQASKWLVVTRMGPGASRPVLGSFMSLTRAANSGAFFSLFASAAGALTVVGAVLAAVVVVWGWRAARTQPQMLAPLALILGGALGNLVDRAARGQVVDFLDFHFWPVFNVADVALTLGVFLAAWRLIRSTSPCEQGEGVG
jgi:signal peptidase II